MRGSISLLLTVCLLVVVAPDARAQPRLRAQPLQVRQVKPLSVQALTAAQLPEKFEQVLADRGVSPGERGDAMEQFRQYPAELQQTLLETMDDRYAVGGNHYELPISRIDSALLQRIHDFVLFRISSFWPAQGSPGAWCYAFGNAFHDNCTVQFDGTEVDSYYVGFSSEFFPRSMAFRVPDDAQRAQDHDVVVYNATADATTPVATYEIVAPRGYRGYHGWKFANFSRPSIAWKLYADYFGAASVQYADGTHRPAAQQYYDDVYTAAGAGGNCYGMSVSSLRVRNHELDHVYHDGYFQAAATAQPYVWDYDWNDTTQETVQQQQGSWYTQEVLDLYNDYWNSQDPRDVFNRCQTLTAQPVNRPVLVYWGQNAAGNWWGHAVCPYSTEVAGNTRRMLCYNNNNPYRENETGSADPDVATVNWTANSFSCGSAFKAQLFSYEECTPANPHLPGAEYGGPGADAVVAVFSPNAQVQQITDENGRTFFNPDGSINDNPATRIPLSSIVPPLVQARPRVIRPRIGPVAGLQVPRLEPPAEAPLIFVFGQAQGKSLTFNVQGQGAKQMSLFSTGRIFSINSNGIGEVRVSNLLTLPAVQILNAQAVGPTQVEFIRSTPAGDRVFQLNNLRNVAPEQLEVVPNAQGTALEVNGPAGLQFNLDVMGPVGQGMQGAAFGNIVLQAGARANLSPANWGAVQNTNLTVRMLNPQNNNVINEQTIQRLR